MLSLNNKLHFIIILSPSKMCQSHSLKDTHVARKYNKLITLFGKK